MMHLRGLCHKSQRLKSGGRNSHSVIRKIFVFQAAQILQHIAAPSDKVKAIRVMEPVSYTCASAYLFN